MSAVRRVAFWLAAALAVTALTFLGEPPASEADRWFAVIGIMTLAVALDRVFPALPRPTGAVAQDFAGSVSGGRSRHGAQ